MLKDIPLTRNMEKVVKDPSFRRMFENYSYDELAEMMIVGKGKLTDAFIEAKKEIAKEQHLQDPVNKKVSKLTAEDRDNFWAQNKFEEPKKTGLGLHLPPI